MAADLFVVAGALAVMVGLYLIYPPLAFIWVGVALMVTGIKMVNK